MSAIDSTAVREARATASPEPATHASAAGAVPLGAAVAYAAPAAGSYFFNIPMWSILPGVYGTYFGLELTAIASVVLFIRLFDGVIDVTIGFLSDRHRAAGGSRKSWVIVGGITSVVACHMLFTPSQPVTATYYLLWSLVYFLAFTIAEIPHLTWGSELSMDYQQRARIFGVRNVLARLGFISFYGLPLLPLYASSEYSPQVLENAVYVGAVMVVAGLLWTAMRAPSGVQIATVPGDSASLLLRSLLTNKPLLLYFCAFGCMGLCYGMWFGLLYFYLDSYLGLGERVAVMFLVATAVSALSTPLWLRLIHVAGKARAWAVGAVLFGVQLACAWFLSPGDSWWLVFALVMVAHVCFSAHDIAALSILGDVVDYGKLRFGRDRGATYFAFNTLIFKIGLGVGGGVSIGIAGLFDFSATRGYNDAAAILGLKLGFIVLPACLLCIGLLFILRTPIDRRRHQIIRRRLESRHAAALPVPERTP